jgi:hypothetical protein
MTSAYVIRKLNESFKVSDALVAAPIPVLQYDLVGHVPDVWHYEFWESYDLEAPHLHGLTLPQVCNQIIHSFVFASSFSDDNHLDGLFVASDFDRRKNLYKIDIEVFVELLRHVSEEDIVSSSLRPNAKGERVWTGLVGKRKPW